MKYMSLIGYRSITVGLPDIPWLDTNEQIRQAEMFMLLVYMLNFYTLYPQQNSVKFLS